MKYTSSQKHKTYQDQIMKIKKTWTDPHLLRRFDHHHHLPTKKYPRQDGFTDEIDQTFEELTPVLLERFQKIEGKEILREVLQGDQKDTGQPSGDVCVVYFFSSSISLGFFQVLSLLMFLFNVHASLLKFSPCFCLVLWECWYGGFKVFV